MDFVVFVVFHALVGLAGVVGVKVAFCDRYKLPDVSAV